MKIIHTLTELRQALAGTAPVLVPTMGNLHAGHLALLERARQTGGPVVASIFVNRLQFLPHEDFDSYPRTFAHDCAALEAAGCDLLFAPPEHELYPQPQTFRVQPDPALADILEGEFRPGFFAGVSTVVMKLFGCVQPAAAVFGRKDYQQLLVIRQLVQQFALPIRIIAGDTVREADGLAMSSRNGYLSADERAEAVQLNRCLQEMAAALRAGQPIADIEAAAMRRLSARGWQPDYLTIRRQADLQAPAVDGAGRLAADTADPLAGNDACADVPAPAAGATAATAIAPAAAAASAAPATGMASPSAGLVILGAARLGRTRLIDNLEL